MDFALDPALLGVAGPSTSSTGRVRDVPSLLQQHHQASNTTRLPLLSDSEASSSSSSSSSSSESESSSSEASDNDSDGGQGAGRRTRATARATTAPTQRPQQAAESDADEEDEEDDEEDEEDGDEDNDEQGARIPASAKGKGRATVLPPLPPIPGPPAALAPSSTSMSTGEPLPPLPPGMVVETPAVAGYDETDWDDDYATDAPVGGISRDYASGELGRLISAIRDTSASSAPTTATSRGLLGQEWDQDLDDDEDEDAYGHEDGGGMAVDQATMMSTGGRRGLAKGKGRRKRRGRVGVADMEPSPEIKNMLGTANLAYVQGRRKEAIDTLTEIIRIEPATKSAWYTLSTIHEELGNRDKAIQLRIVVAHLGRSNPDVWKELGAQSRELGLLDQAIYCYGQATRSDRNDVEAVWDRASLLRETGKIRQASTWFAKLLKLQPHNPAILRELGPLYYELNEVAKAVQLYQAAYEHFKSLYPIPTALNSEELQGWSDADFELFSDFLRSLRRYREAGKVITEGVRWLQGRLQEGASWNSFGDDREYDLERRMRPGWESHPQRWCEDAPIHPLETGLRLRLGLSRLYEGRSDEAKHHFNIIRQRDVTDIPDTYGEIADALFDKKLWVDALEVYIEMAENEETNVPAVWVKIAECQRHSGELRDAAESYQAVIQNEPEDLDSKLALAEIYERLDMREQALELVNEVIEKRREARAAEPEHSDDSGSEYVDEGGDSQENTGLLLSQRRKKRKSASQRRLNNAARRRAMTYDERMQEERAVQDAFDTNLLRLHEVDRMMEQTADPVTGAVPEHLHLEWLDIVSYLIDTFRTTKPLFPSDGKKRYMGGFGRQFKRRQKETADTDLGVDEQAAGIAERLEASLANDDMVVDEPDANVDGHAYRGVSFDDWAALAVRYAFMLTRIDERDEAQEVLRHMLTSSMIRQDEPRNQLLLFGLAACSICSDDYETALEDLRKVIAGRKLESEPLRLLQAVCHSGFRCLDAFLNNKFQKYLLRMIKIIDQMALSSNGGGGGGVDDKDDSADEADGTILQGEDGGFRPTKVNPQFLMLYGHIMACGKSYQSAIVYYLRAYDQRSDDPLICLSLALAYTHRAMQRQTDNRHHQLAQALAFLDGYRKNRGNDQEVQYNVARIFHQLGIVDLAAKHYEEVLRHADEARKQNASLDSLEHNLQKLDLSREAAYNLSSIYFTRNAPDLAREVVDKYLSL